MKREYLDALIESYLAHSVPRSDGVVRREDGSWTFRCLTDEHVTVRDEIRRLCEVQRSMGLEDYFERRTA